MYLKQQVLRVSSRPFAPRSLRVAVILGLLISMHLACLLRSYVLCVYCKVASWHASRGKESEGGVLPSGLQGRICASNTSIP